MNFLCKENFKYGGPPISFAPPKDNASTVHFGKSDWRKGMIYEGRYYQGGVACPREAYLMTAENGKSFPFVVTPMEDNYYPCISDYFEIL